ncbi:MAG: GPW/gp25 family protein [Halieaceae bacterium]|jgi:phage baseplate assembly protein W|nr:GPW/gp25 family protein [Halieaceae bacterium]
MSDVAFPFAIGPDGGTAGADPRRHLRDLIVQVLLTSPGERVMRPNFGAGIGALVFEPMGDAIAATLEQSAHAALQRELGSRVTILGVSARPGEGRLTVSVSYSAGNSAAEVIEVEIPA